MTYYQLSWNETFGKVTKLDKNQNKSFGQVY